MTVPRSKKLDNVLEKSITGPEDHRRHYGKFAVSGTHFLLWGMISTPNTHPVMSIHSHRLWALTDPYADNILQTAKKKKKKRNNIGSNSDQPGPIRSQNFCKFEALSSRVCNYTALHL